MPSGRMMKYRAASSSWPAPNSSPPNVRDRKSLARAAGAVQDQHCVAHDASGVALRRPDRPIMELQRRQRFARPELEIARTT